VAGKMALRGFFLANDKVQITTATSFITSLWFHPQLAWAIQGVWKL